MYIVCPKFGFGKDTYFDMQGLALHRCACAGRCKSLGKNDPEIAVLDAA